MDVFFSKQFLLIFLFLGGDLYDFLIWGVDQSFNIWGAGGIGGSMKIFQLDQFHPFFWLFVKEINVF